MPERNLDLPRSPPEMSTAFLPSALRLRYLARYLLSLVLHPLAAVIPRAVRAAGILRVDQAVVIPRVARTAVTPRATQALALLQAQADAPSPVCTLVQALFARPLSHLSIRAFSAVVVPLNMRIGLETITGGAVIGAYFLDSCGFSFLH